jgi:hypothetical protein
MSYFEQAFSVVDTGNSTTTPLGISGVFTGTAIDVTEYGTVTVAVFSDQNSATDGLSIEFSVDGVNWDHSDTYDYVASTGKVYKVGKVARYFRIVYTNGLIAQTELRLQVMLEAAYTKPSSHRITDEISTQDDAELVKSVIAGEDRDNVFRNIGSSVDGRLKTVTNLDNVNISAFGDQASVPNRPFVQAIPTYNLIPANFREFDSLGGSTGTEDRKFKVSSGTSAGGFGAIQSFRSLNYKAGEGGLCRCSGYFANNAADSWSGIGILSIGDELSFGYDGTDFGIWHRFGGLAEVRTITITAAAGGAETLTLTLNSVAYVIPLTAGTVQHNAYEVEAWLNDSANQTVWAADQVDDTVIVNALSDGAKSGTYSFSSTGTATGTIAQDVGGVTKTSNHIAQTDWNENPMPDIDPSKGNVYQIEFQDLQFGDAYFYMEDPGSGKIDRVHTLQLANESTTPHIGNPSLRAGMYAANITNTTNIDVFGGGFGLFMQGEEGRTRNPRAIANTQSIGTTFSTILTLRNRRTYNGYTNQVEIEPELLSIAAEGSKNVVIEVRSLVDTGVEQDFQPAGENLVSDFDISSVSITGGRFLLSITVAGGTSATVDLQSLRIRIPPSLKLAVLAKKASGANVDVTASLTYYEDL